MLRLLIILSLFFNQHAFANNKNNESKIELNWVIDHTPQKYFEVAIKVMSEELKAASKGNMDVKMNSIASYARIDKRKIRSHYIDMLNNNQVGVAQIYIDEFADNDKFFEVLNMPYLFRDHEHVSKVINGPIGQKLLDRLEKRGLKGLAFTYSGGFQNFLSGTKLNYFSTNPFSGVLAGNFSTNNMKALKLTPPSDDVVNNFFPYYPFHLLVGMEKIDLALVTFADSDEVFKDYRGKKQLYYYDTNFKVLFTIITLNKKFYDSLTTEQQKILANAAKKAATAERNMIIEDSQKTRENIENGSLTNQYISYIKMNESEMAALKKIANNSYNYFGKDELKLIKEIQDTK